MTVENKEQLEFRLCECGCGTKVTQLDKAGKNFRRFAYGHFRNVKDLKVECACGCGTLIPKFDKKHGDERSTERLFAHGHNNKEERHWQWKGGRRLNHWGYVMVQCRGHPDARPSNGHYVFEHRLVMEKAIGRYLKDNEVIHHINRDKTDNRLENLQLFENQSLHLQVDKKKDMTGRKCSDCGSETTRVSKPAKPTHSPYHRWYPYNDDSGQKFRCSTCYDKYKYKMYKIRKSKDEGQQKLDFSLEQ